MSTWVVLGAAIIAEVAGTSFLKLSDGFSRLGPSVAVVSFYVVSFALLAQALKTIDVGVAYAIWAGLGIALVAVAGVLFFGEPISLVRVGCFAFIVVGAAGLYLTSATR